MHKDRAGLFLEFQEDSTFICKTSWWRGRHATESEQEGLWLVVVLQSLHLAELAEQLDSCNYRLALCGEQPVREQSWKPANQEFC